MACAVLNGRPVAVTGGDDGTARVWDLASGRRLGEPLAGHDRAVRALACAVVDGRWLAVTGEDDGRPVAVTGGDDGTMQVWDLASGGRLSEPLAGHDGAVRAVDCAVADGRPVAVSGGEDRTVRVWELASGRQLGKSMTGHQHWINTVACSVLDGRPVAVTGSHDRTVRVWDLESRQSLSTVRIPYVAAGLAIDDARGIVVGFGNEVCLLELEQM